jgi:hypothetical protein
LLLDACCAINLFATPYAGEILAAFAQPIAIAQFVVEHEVTTPEFGQTMGRARPHRQALAAQCADRHRNEGALPPGGARIRFMPGGRRRFGSRSPSQIALLALMHEVSQKAAERGLTPARLFI